MDTNSSNKYGFKPIQKVSDVNYKPKPKENPEDQKYGFQPIKSVTQAQKEGFLESKARQFSGTLARGIESLFGQAGEFHEIADYITKPIADAIIPLSEEQKEKRESLTKLPTSSKLRQQTKKVTGEYLEPKGKIEEGVQEAASLSGALFGPMKFRKSLGVAIGSQAAKEGVGLFGGSKTAQEGTKLGTMLLLSIINPNGIKRFWQDAYGKRDQLTPVGTFVKANKLENTAKEIVNDLKKGTVAPSEAKVLTQAEKVLDKINKGKVDLNEMVAVKRSLNEVAGDPEVFKRAQHVFPKLQKAVDEVIALHPDKEALKYHQMGNEAFGGFHQSQKITKFAQKYTAGKPLSAILFGLGVEAIAGHPALIVPSAMKIGAGIGIAKTAELMMRVNANPTLRKYYLNVLINASKENARATARSINEFEKELSKEDEKEF